jgi:hypothetical protein
VLKKVILDVIRNREERLLGIRDQAYEKILDTAKSLWVDYEPIPKQANLIGIDSSWNSKSFQGMDMYVVAAAAVDSLNNLLRPKYEHDIRPIKDTHLQNTALAMEIDLCQEVLDNDDSSVICLDGSLVSKLIQASGNVKEHLVSLLLDSPINARLGDIYYFNHVSQTSGFSSPVSIGKEYAEEFGYIAETFVRLKQSTPILKIEIAVGKKSNRNIDANFVRNMLEVLSYYSIAGYPQCLAYAHEACEIKGSDMNEIASIYGMKDEIGSRALLEG